MNYHISPYYIDRKEIRHHDDTSFTDEYQNEVYKFAQAKFLQKEYTSLADVGCGSAFKLFKFFLYQDWVGLEINPTLSWLKNRYPNYTWVESTGENIRGIDTDLIICADVIEHIERPDSFLENICQANFKKLILSTPDRRLVSSLSGPPVNPCHYREWTMPEFISFVSDYFFIKSTFISNEGQGTICVECRKW